MRKASSFGLGDELPKRRTLERSEPDRAVPVRPHRQPNREMAEAAVAVVEQGLDTARISRWHPGRVEDEGVDPQDRGRGIVGDDRHGQGCHDHPASPNG